MDSVTGGEWVRLLLACEKGGAMTEIVRPEKIVKDLADVLLQMGLTLHYSVNALDGLQRWMITAKNGETFLGLGVGTTRADTSADLLLCMDIELTIDDPDNPLARWGRPYRGYDDRVALEHIGWAKVSEIQGWRKALKSAPTTIPDELTY